MSESTGAVRRRRRRSGVVSAAVLTVLCLVVTGFALRYPGLTSSEVEVNNGGVWVTNTSEGLMGRLNVDARELDARVPMVGDELDIIQSGYSVFETGPRGLTPINTAGTARLGVVELPAGTEVKIGGDRLVISASDGRVWVLSPDEAAAFAPGSVEPTYTAEGRQPRVAVSDGGTVFALDGDQLLRFPRTEDTRETKAAKPIQVGNVSTDPEMLELTTVGEEPVILDREKRLLRLGTAVRDYDLTEHGVPELDSARLQQSSAASDDVVLATADSLLVIPLRGGDPEIHSAQGTGTPVAPAQAKGCAYGAWNGSQAYVRACEGAEVASDHVPEADSAGDLTLRVNQDLVVLNDQAFGTSWMIAQDMEPVDDWVIEQEIQKQNTTEKEKETLTTTVSNTVPERDQENRDPVANDDEFGVRPGASVVLPVTRNDTDADGDVLTVSVDGEQPGIGTVTPIRGGTQLQIEVAEDASGDASFTYRADDGRGGTDTATVDLSVSAEGENGAPQPALDNVLKVQVRSGQEITANIAPYWEDPDGDAFYLSSASVDPEDIVTFLPDGTLTFNDAGLTTGDKEVPLTFTDEQGEQGEGTLVVEVVTDTDLAPITTADHAGIVAGRSTTIKPLVNDLNANGGELELTHVSETEGLAVDAALEAGTLEVSGETPGTYYLQYTVAAAGSSTSSIGIIRVDVTEPGSEELVPVAVDDLGTVTTGTETLIDPLENDVDPTGGVLVVNSIEVPEGSGLKATVIGHHLVKIEAAPDAVVSDEPIALTYTVANSAGTAEGTVRVMLARTDTQFANPIAVPDTATVRAGDMVMIDALANDTSPTGEDLQLGELSGIEAADAAGHIETHDDRIRFSAAADADGEITLEYDAVDATGRQARARVTITVVPRDAPNSAPRPENLTARTVAGTPVRIPVRTTGIDPDGDSVMITGLTSPTPALGEVTEANGEWIEYVPFEGSTGTDRFRYQVMDRGGAIGTGEVLVGIAPPNGVNQPPYAVDDVLEVRPDREVQAFPLENDTDPEGTPLSVDHGQVESLSGIEVLPADSGPESAVTVRTPSEPGTHTVLYAASDGQLTSPASITVKVDPNAELKNPVARDDFVPAEQVMDPEAEYVDVDLLANDTDPDGSTADLTVTLDPDAGTETVAENVELREDGIARVVPQEEQQRVRYKIEDLDGLVSYGYLWVPGTARQVPVWVGEPVQAAAGQDVTIDLSSSANVRVRPGATGVTITDPALVSAAETDGTELVVDETTLNYRARDGYSGQDTISVEVTDGEVGDSSAATAVLAIPVEVSASENMPPTLQGAALKVEQGGDPATVDLAASASDPEDDALTFTLGEYDESRGVALSLEGGVVTATADASADRGGILEVPVTVADGTNDPVTATLQVSVTGSNRPLISTGLDEAVIFAGETDTLDVLENDSNPFPDGKREIVSATVTSGEGTAKVVGDAVEITPAAGWHGILSAQYRVRDQTGDPEREVSGEIRVQVHDVPDAPSAPRINDVGDEFVELSFDGGADNGTPITGYTVTSASGPAVSQECASTTCRITGLTNDTEYTFQVVATNEVGDSDPSVPSAEARPDVRPEQPAPPRPERGDTQLTVSWTTPLNRGSAIRNYDLQMQDTSTGETFTRELDGGTTETVWEGLTNGTDYRFRVRARNLAEEPSEWSDWSATEHPAGRPGAPGGVMTAERTNSPLGGGVTVTWPAMTAAESNGEPITEYEIAASSGETATVDASSGTNSHTFRDLNRDQAVSFTYRGVNSVGTGTGSSKASNEVTPYGVPEAPAKPRVSLPDASSGDGPNGRVRVEWDAPEDNGTRLKEYVVRWEGGSRTVTADKTSVTIDGLTNGKAYTFTVQASNRFDGGQSSLSTASDGATPYTRPAKPTVKASPGSCSGTTCTVNFSYSANGTGGGGKVTLTCSIDGGKFEACKQSVSGKSGANHTIVVRATNAKGLTSEAKDDADAPTAKPEIKNPSASGSANSEAGCTSGAGCYYIDFTLTGLKPNTSYSYCIKGDGSAGGNCWYPTSDGVNSSGYGTLTTDSNGNWHLKENGRAPFWGNRGAGVWVSIKIDGTTVETDKVYPVN